MLLSRTARLSMMYSVCSVRGCNKSVSLYLLTFFFVCMCSTFFFFFPESSCAVVFRMESTGLVKRLKVPEYVLKEGETSETGVFCCCLYSDTKKQYRKHRRAVEAQSYTHFTQSSRQSRVRSSAYILHQYKKLLRVWLQICKAKKKK